MSELEKAPHSDGQGEEEGEVKEIEGIVFVLSPSIGVQAVLGQVSASLCEREDVQIGNR